MFHTGPNIPPPPPGFRPGGPQQQQQRPQGPPAENFMPMPMRHPLQQSTHIQDITPHKILDEAACLKKLTSYAAYTIRKEAPRDAKDKPTWARAEIIEERFPKEEVIKQIKKLDKESKRTVTEKKIALATYQQGQITRLLDDLGSKEHDMNFGWSLVQIDSKTKPISSTRGTSKKSLYETVTMTVYVKRAPIGDLNAIQLYQGLERLKAERLRPPPPQHQQPQAPPQQQQFRPPPQQQGGAGQGGQQQGPIRIPPPPNIIELNRNGPAQGGNQKPQGNQQQQHPQQERGNSRGAKKFHRKDDSSSESDSRSGSSGSDTESDDSSRSSVSSRRLRKHSKGPARKSSFRRESKHFIEASPHRHQPIDDFGGIPTQNRPYAPVVPRGVPGIDPIASAYRAGRQDAVAENFGESRLIQQPRQIIQPVIERIIDPRTIGTFRRVESQYAPLPRRIEPHYHEERYADDLRYSDDFRSAQDDMIVRQREAEDHMDRLRLDHGRGPIELNRRSGPRDFFERRNTEFDARPLERPEYFERRYSDAHPLHPREIRQENFGRGPSAVRSFPRDFSPQRRSFPRDSDPFAPISLPRRYQESSTTSGDGW
ncbi:uncharacterized protein RAG0_05373 [Rhynchosporium agropyri]|uniref:Uncharacterized protein n=1 Tax=Rhynchosporium agropyri TaxID=914238 RepID=A0A1E1KCU3_9HELO|nr:uncharacterized protein RAG0_05373 [Rhynchosporium agropyri]